jgi:hypothetical protein
MGEGGADVAASVKPKYFGVYPHRPTRYLPGMAVMDDRPTAPKEPRFEDQARRACQFR